MKLGKNQIRTLLLQVQGWYELTDRERDARNQRLLELGLLYLTRSGMVPYRLTQLGRGVACEARRRIGSGLSDRGKAAAKRHFKRADSLLPSRERLREMFPVKGEFND